MGLYSQGNVFSPKGVNRKVLALILNFSTVCHGEAYGRDEFEGSTPVLWKRHIFKAVGGAIMGGGTTFGIHGGSIRQWIGQHVLTKIL